MTKQILSIFATLILTGCSFLQPQDPIVQDTFLLGEIPEFSGDPYVIINDNQPEFDTDSLTVEIYEEYSNLDNLGRCGEANAVIGKESMPDEPREDISNVTPSGWKNKEYDTSIIDTRYVYNRCHLIGFQLTGQNDNEKNLITGTRYMNTEGMLPFENMIADFINDSDYHVRYRVTPIYEGNNLVASGVQMEAYSIEDNGDGICFNVYVYNNQPYITIDYASGENWLEGEMPITTPDDENNDIQIPDKSEQTNEEPSQTTDNIPIEEADYVLNISSKKFHYPDCSSVATTKPENRQNYVGSREELINQGYEPCGRCEP